MPISPVVPLAGIMAVICVSESTVSVSGHLQASDTSVACVMLFPAMTPLVPTGPLDEVKLVSVLVQEVAGQDYCTERSEAKEDKAQDSVDETEEDRANAVGDEANDDDQRGEPGHQAGGGHQDSPHRGAVAQD